MPLLMLAWRAKAAALIRHSFSMPLTTSVVDLPEGDVVVYKYGCRLDSSSEPIADQQIVLARRLYNELIAQMRETLRLRSARELELGGPPLQRLAEELRTLDDSFKAAKGARNAELLRSVAERRATVRTTWRTLLREVRLTHKQELKTYLACIGRKSSCVTYQTRSRYVRDGLGWATANQILDSALAAFQDSLAQGTSPRFASSERSSKNTLRIQFAVAGGVDVEALVAGKNPEVKASYPVDGCGPRRYGAFSVRMGPATSNEWAKGTWQVHRPLPENARVAAVSLIRERVSTHYHWTLQFLVRLDSPLRRSVPSGRVKLAALHLGWSSDDAGRQFGALAESSDAGLATILHLPAKVESGLRRSALTQSERDASRDEVVQLLKKLDGQETLWPSGAIDEFRAIVSLAPGQVAIPRLHRLWWILHEHGYTDSSLNWFSEWRKQDRLRHQRSIGQARAARMHRRDFYRQLSLEQCTRYACIAISSPDLTKAALLVDASSGERTALQREARAGRVVVALYEYREALRWAAARCNTVLVDVTGPSASGCSTCGGNRLVQVENAGHAMRSCLDCLSTFDKKCNAAAQVYRHLSSHASDMIADSLGRQAALKEERDRAKRERLVRIQSAARQTRTATRPASADRVE